VGDGAQKLASPRGDAELGAAHKLVSPRGYARGGAPETFIEGDIAALRHTGGGCFLRYVFS
jgi:hypothetical protein